MWRGLIRRSRLSCDEITGDAFFVFSVKVGYAHKIEDYEAIFIDIRRQAAATPAHLPIENGTFREPRHYQIDNLRAVEAGVEHVHADENLRECLLLESFDDGADIRRRAAADIADDEVGIAHCRVWLQVCKLVIEHHCQCFGVASGDCKDDGLTLAGETLDTIPTSEAVIKNGTELAYHRVVAFRDGELSFQCLRIHNDSVRSVEQLLEFGPRRFIHRRPVEFPAFDFEATFGRGLYRHGFVYVIGCQIALLDCLAEPVAKRRRVEFKEP